MAILRNQVSKSTEPSLRKKQRDYTIPIRLNQRLPPSSGQVNLMTQVSAHSTGRRAAADVTYSKRKTINQLRGGRRSEVSGGSDSNKMIHPISMRATNNNNKRFLPAVLVVVAACATLTISTEICHCDTMTSLHSAPSSSINRAASSSSLPAPGDNNLNSQKENLLTALTDNIERQHFKMKPARALIQQRPSKFDSAEYLAGELNLDAGIDYIKKKAQPLASIKKVDDSMRQILRMHEHHQHNAETGFQPASSVATPAEQSPAKGWRKIARSPILTNSLNPNKVVSKVLAYVTPLVSSKLSDSSVLGSESFMMKNLTSATDGPRLRLHPFAARSNNQVRTILTFRPFPTASPETSSLMRPDNFNRVGGGGGGSSSSSSSSRFQYPTPPSTLMSNHFGKGSTSIKTGGGATVDSIINDLMADSSDNSITASLDAAAAGISSHLSGGSGSPIDEDRSKKPLTETANHIVTTSVSKQPQKSAASLLKKGANHIAQNYFQNSFRDLITLSQLPILSTSSTSTAPSVLEKKRKPNKVDKAGGSKYRRRRLIEDLYRYAYMLSTGVRNKRDPLEALGSSPSPLISVVGKKSVLSQRSINRLMASNHNLLLNYVRKLRSMLPVGPMSKAKPRGVMWDVATDPSLAVTVFHLLERASVALPLGFLLLPVVQMIRHPLNGLNLGRILPARASHRSVDIEELAKRLDVVDKMLSRALRSTHRESFMGK